jgi:hypothetical protein
VHCLQRLGAQRAVALWAAAARCLASGGAAQPGARQRGGAPPSTEGKSASSTRCPVSSGVSASSFCATGRGERTGHSCFMQYFCGGRRGSGGGGGGGLSAPSHPARSSGCGQEEPGRPVPWRACPARTAPPATGRRRALSAATRCPPAPAPRACPLGPARPPAHLLGALELHLDDLLVDGVAAGGRHVGDVAARAGRQHDPVLDHRVLVHQAVDVAARDPVAHLRGKQSCLSMRRGLRLLPPGRPHAAEAATSRWAAQAWLPGAGAGAAAPRRQRRLALKLVGLNSHCFEGSRAGTATPRGMKQSPLSTAIVLSGRWMPSKMLPRMPGPSSTDRGCAAQRRGGAALRGACIPCGPAGPRAGWPSRRSAGRGAAPSAKGDAPAAPGAAHLLGAVHHVAHGQAGGLLVALRGAGDRAGASGR